MKRIEQIKALYAKSTPGPWERISGMISKHDEVHSVASFRYHGGGTKEDGDLIVALHEAWPLFERLYSASLSYSPFLPVGDLLGAGKYSAQNRAAKELRDILAAFERGE